jgi:hypothetical protein
MNARSAVLRVKRVLLATIMQVRLHLLGRILRLRLALLQVAAEAMLPAVGAGCLIHAVRECIAAWQANSVSRLESANDTNALPENAQEFTY